MWASPSSRWSSSTPPLDNIRERPDGVKIAGFFIAAIVAGVDPVATPAAFELRTTEVVFDESSAAVPARLRTSHHPAGSQRTGRPGPRRVLARSSSRSSRTTTFPMPSDIIFVEVTVTDPSDFEGVVEVHGEVLHDVYRVITLPSLHRAQRSCCAAAGDPRCDRRPAAHLLRVDRGQPGRPTSCASCSSGSARSPPSPGRFFARRSPPEAATARPRRLSRPQGSNSPLTAEDSTPRPPTREMQVVPSSGWGYLDADAG